MRGGAAAGRRDARPTLRARDARVESVDLRELTIRGDIHTPVEFLIHLLEQDDFVGSRVHTAYLDKVIRDGMGLVPKPQNFVAVVCGAAGSPAPR